MNIETQARQIVAGQQNALAAYMAKGAAGWSAMRADPPKVETLEAVVARLNEQSARAVAYRQTPAGRFLSVIEWMEDAGMSEAASRLRQLRSMFLFDGFAGPLQPRYVGMAIKLLMDTDSPWSHEGVRALADMLEGE